MFLLELSFVSRLLKYFCDGLFLADDNGRIVLLTKECENEGVVNVEFMCVCLRYLNNTNIFHKQKAKNPTTRVFYNVDIYPPAGR